MSESLLDRLPEVFVSDTAMSAIVSRAVKQRKLRKLASRLYTRNLEDPPEALVRRHLWHIVGAYFPGALIADRTALEAAPASDGSVFLIADKTRDIALPGITLRPRKGPGPLPSDQPFMADLRLSSTARAYLENLVPSRGRPNAVARTLSRDDIETRLDTLLRRSGEDALNRLRDEARGLAPQLGLDEAFTRLDRLVGALLATRSSALLKTAVGRARAQGAPYDPARLELFQLLHAALRQTAPAVRLVPPGPRPALPFFEAYFSNFIEGTEFEINEAAEIILEGKIPANRPEDAHDVIGTYRLTADVTEMRRLPKDGRAFEQLLKSRHARIMESRPEKGPGKFKTEGNRAGATTFVAPDLVRGTLAQGFDLYRSLEAPFQRAVFMMFLVSEVHPFADGNGRTARIMMNADLVAGGEERIIIPIVYRNNYLAALKALSLNRQPEPLIRVLDFAQRYTAAVDWSTIQRAQALLESTNALADPQDADQRGIRLILPTPDLLAAVTSP